MSLSSAHRLLLVLSLCASACGSTHTPGDKSYAASVAPGTREPASEVESAVLAQLAAIADDTPTQIAGATVTAGPVYFAASGKRCRRVRIEGSKSEDLLACEMGSQWRYVPNVFVYGASST